MSETTTIAAGSLFCFSTGEYSDYGYAGHFVALEDVTRERLNEIADVARREVNQLDEIQDAWLATPEAERGGEYPYVPDIHSAFIAAVIKAGLVLAVTCSELHIGSYGELELP